LPVFNDPILAIEEFAYMHRLQLLSIFISKAGKRHKQIGIFGFLEAGNGHLFVIEYAQL